MVYVCVWCETIALHESIELFEEICNNKYFKRSEVMLFLNKCDLFRERLRDKIDLDVCFGMEEGNNKEEDKTDQKAVLTQELGQHDKALEVDFCALYHWKEQELRVQVEKALNGYTSLLVIDNAIKKLEVKSLKVAPDGTNEMPTEEQANRQDNNASNAVNTNGRNKNAFGQVWNGKKYNGPRYADRRARKEWLQRQYFNKKNSILYKSQNQQQPSKINDSSQRVEPLQSTKPNESDLLFAVVSSPTVTPRIDNELTNPTALTLSSPPTPHHHPVSFHEDDEQGRENPTKHIKQSKIKRTKSAQSNLVDIDGDMKIDYLADEAWFEYCYDCSIQFLTNLFLLQNQNIESKMIYVHVTNATNRENVEDVMREVQDIIVSSMFRNYDMI
ncbi:guanine nucleotide binding protein, alpha transducing 2-like isoform 2 [Reticulomyxa filosa]|uniref:Guanine nucleotide binding protein, alpha transducing 2-like isoform 2 n=1 Tax=Reticulomyxa filosa TaxID=46433 RepID=X6NRR1_RETFI|nr:guanine nucleotide binding protein, alpha transducing 2-like isoform 2 [Reticulomyxa filosa]|eukprot:ETO28027.1 guanine nucleotide binding protein, alpha transducing 2-like isoform 2 [Reticulomyxa filosa]